MSTNCEGVVNVYSGAMVEECIEINKIVYIEAEFINLSVKKELTMPEQILVNSDTCSKHRLFSTKSEKRYIFFFLCLL